MHRRAMLYRPKQLLRVFFFTSDGVYLFSLIDSSQDYLRICNFIIVVPLTVRPRPLCQLAHYFLNQGKTATKLRGHVFRSFQKFLRISEIIVVGFDFC